MPLLTASQVKQAIRRMIEEENPFADEVARGINFLPAAFKTQANLDAFMALGVAPFAGGVATGLSVLPAAFQTQANLDALMAPGVAKFATSVAIGMSALPAAFQTQANLDAFMAPGVAPFADSRGFGCIPAALQTQANLDAFMAPDVARFVASFSGAIEALPVALQTQSNLEAFMAPGVAPFAGLLGYLPAACKTQANLDAFMAPGVAEFIRPVCFTLSALPVALQTQANLDALKAPGARLHLQNIYVAFSGVPPHLFTQAVFAHILAHPLAPQALALQAFAPEAMERNINLSPSTHTASVHKSVSEAATKLLHRYGASLNGEGLERIIGTINAWAAALPASKSYDSVKTAIGRLLSVEYRFTDPTSEISTRQLLALVWTGVHDETLGLRSSTAEDAERSFIKGLWEAQNEYAPNSPACASGTFNKIVSTLWGIHADVELRYITVTTASARLPIVVNEAAGNYLSALPTDARHAAKIIATIRDHDCLPESIWPHIVSSITETMFQEFGDLFPAGKEGQKFRDFIANGVFTQITEEVLNAPLALSASLPTAGNAALSEESTPTTTRPSGKY